MLTTHDQKRVPSSVTAAGPSPLPASLRHAGEEKKKKLSHHLPGSVQEQSKCSTVLRSWGFSHVQRANFSHYNQLTPTSICHSATQCLRATRYKPVALFFERQKTQPQDLQSALSQATPNQQERKPKTEEGLPNKHCGSCSFSACF